MLSLDAVKFLEYIHKKDDVANAEKDAESEDYSACTFTLFDKKVVFRSAKKTPKKVGLFVTLWKRLHSKSDIYPFEEKDPIDFVIIKSEDEFCFGYFIFPKSVLIKHKVLSTQFVEGKRAIRVYTPFHHPQNKQALKTQKWQSQWFYKDAKNMIEFLSR